MGSDTTRTVALGTLTMRPDGILHAVFDFTGPPSAAAADEFLAVRSELAGEKPARVIVEIRRIPYTTRWIRRRFMRQMPETVCRAVVTTNESFRAMFRTYDLLSPRKTPSRVFATVEQAVGWITTAFPGHSD